MQLSTKSRTIFRKVSILTLALLLLSLLAYQLIIPHTTAHAANPQADWSPVPLVPQEALNDGFTGGEGGQVIRSIKWSVADPNFLLMATDVGGIFRSIDAGEHWQSAMVGWNARGGEGFAFDPKNGNRALGVGGNSFDDPSGKKPNGLYLTTDKGASWRQVLPQTTGYDSNQSVTYDPSSYDANLGYCKVAYYVTAGSGIYKSTDGGQSWNQVNSGYSGTHIRVHPTRGYVYLTSDQNPSFGTAPGFYKSIDGGVTFSRKTENYSYSLDVSPADPEKVWVSRYDWVLVSNDGGETFGYTGRTGLPDCCSTAFNEITVSPLDSRYMSVFWPGPNYDTERYYSTDGGATWVASQYADKPGICDPNNRQAKYVLLPCNVRDGRWAYSPTDARTVFSTGGDWITKSTDGGAHYTWHGNGDNGIFVPTLNFNPNNPNNVLISSKDYSSYASTNGGRSFTYAQTSFDFGGYDFGGIALDDQVMWTGTDPRIDSQGDPELNETTNGGRTWFKPQYNGKNIVVATNANKYDLVSYVDPRNNDIGFIGGWRTTNHGNSWAPMSGVTNVYTANPSTGTLYGANGNDVVSSDNHGDSWTKVVTASDHFRELAYDQVHNRVWLAESSKLEKYENGQLSTVAVPQDQYQNTHVAAVAVDPGNPDIVYVGGNANLWSATNTIIRSTDGGQHWEDLTVSTPLANGSVSGGPHEVWWITVNPQTHEAWVSTNCFGIWKIPAPGGAAGNGLKGEYYNTVDLSGSSALTRTDAQVNFDWGTGSPASGINSDNFSVRWSGQVQAPVTGDYSFTTISDDGVRLWINGQLVIDNWTDHPPTSNGSAAIALSAGQKYSVRMEFYERGGGAVAKLLWLYPGQGQEAIPQSALFPA